MKKQEVILGIDIGAYDIKFAMGIQNEEDVDIISVSSIPTQGLVKGEIVSFERLSEVLKIGMDRVIYNASCRASKTYVCLSSRYFIGMSANASQTVSDGMITHKDIIKVIQSSHQYYGQQQGIAHSIMHSIPQHFIIDHQIYTNDPWGKPGVSLDVNIFLMFLHKDTINAYQKLLTQNNIVIQDLFCDQLVLGETVRKGNENKKYLMLDIGAETTKVMIFEGGSLVYFRCFQQAGNDLTHLIEEKLEISEDEAEFLKIKHADVYQDVSEEHKIYLPNQKIIKVQILNRLVEKYMRELLSSIWVRLNQDKILLVDMHIFLSGGTSNLMGIVELTREIFKCQAQKIKSTQSGTNDLVSPPQFATVNGLVLAGLRNQQNLWFATMNRKLTDIKESHIKPLQKKKGFFAFLND